jgi:arylsulfatase A-like enzyme
MKGKPNIVYVFADQWRRQAAGFMKEDPVMTPNMDQFAQESAVVRNAVSCTPLCSPHRAALLTGRYALSTGVYTNCKLGADIMLSPEEECISDVLHREGYATGYIGKWHLDLPELNVSENPVSGAKRWDAYTPPGPKRHGFDFWYSYGAFDQHLKPHYWKDTPEKIQMDQWSPEHETDVALSFIEERGRNKDQPFALFISWNPPHTPFELVPEKYQALYDEENIQLRANANTLDTLQVHTGETFPGGHEKLVRYTRDYYAAVSGLDDQFGRLLQGLQEQGFADNTIVVLTSDHGELLGSHGLMAKHSWHEESIGVPFIIRWPEAIRPVETDLVLNTVDIMPTLLSMAGLTIPDSVQGEDLSNVLLEGKAETEDRMVYLSAFPGRKEAMDAYRDAGLDNRLYGWRAVRNRRYTYVVHKGYFPGEPEVRLLYDLEEDPYQVKPISIRTASEHPVAEGLERELAHFLSLTGDGFTV